MKEELISIKEYAKVVAEKEILQQRCTHLEFRLAQLERMLFSAKSEKFISSTPPGQLLLFGEAPTTEAVEVKKEKVVVPAHERTKKRKEKPVRQELPKHLPRIEHIIEPDFDTTGMKLIGHESREQIVYRKAELFVLRELTPKYLLEEEIEGEKICKIQTPSFPSRFIERSIGHPSLYAWLIVDKYLYHNPLYRSKSRLAQMGYNAASSTLSGWVQQSGDKLKILYEKIRYLVLLTAYLQADETRIEVHEKRERGKGGKNDPKKGKTHRGWLWTYYAVLEKLVFFEYDKTRSANNPMLRLKDFTGTLQSDCYDAYDTVEKVASFVHYHDLVHARRNFVKSMDYNQKKAEYLLSLFNQLFALERLAKEKKLSYDEIYVMRQKQAKPILEELFNWMEKAQNEELPGSPLLKAMAYMLKRKPKMMHYLSDGKLCIDTNVIENLIRPIAIGRKNYLFAGSHDAAQMTAMFYTFFACCKLNGINPEEWLLDVMMRINDHPINKIEELLPHKWVKSDNFFSFDEMIAKGRVIYPDEEIEEILQNLD